MESAGHLRTLGKLPRPLSAYENVYYLLVARDHWCWVEPQASIASVSFDALAAALKAPDSLHANLQGLLQYEWLPQETRDFYVQFDTATANGVSIESPVFYSTAPTARVPHAAASGSNS